MEQMVILSVFLIILLICIYVSFAGVRKKLVFLDKKIEEMMHTIERKLDDEKGSFSSLLRTDGTVLCRQCKAKIEDGNSGSLHPKVESGGFFTAAEASDKSIFSKCDDVNIADSIGFTPLHSAAYKNNKEAAEQLILRGAQINQKDGFGRTPLHWAAYKGHKEIIMLLISKNADISIKNSNGLTPLHVAASYGNSEIVKLLISTGAQLNVKDEDQKTPLDMATENGHQETIRILKEYKAFENQ